MYFSFLLSFVTLSFCTPVLWLFIYDIHCIYFSFIYMMIYVVIHLSLHVLFLFYFILMFLYVCNLYFCFILRCLDKFCLKCFKKTSYENLSCHELSFCKVFQEFVLGLDLFVIHKCYEFSDLRLLSWFICLLWFCHGL